MPTSPLQDARSKYQPKLPGILSGDLKAIAVQTGKPTASIADQDAIRAIFPRTYGQAEVQFSAGGSGLSSAPLKVGFVLSGGPASGGHNVVAGLFDGLKRLNPANQLFGFLGGPSGILKNKSREITADSLQPYRNTGGFNIVGSGRTKLESEADYEACRKTLKDLGISVLVVVGGDDSNTNAAVLAEYFAQKEPGLRVVGAPKTIDGDLKNANIEVSFGFDTATRTYAEMVGNISRDAMSGRKYWHFIKLMGRSASHIALDVALKTRPNVCLISEEVAAAGQTLAQVTEICAQAVARRAAEGRDFGVVLIPEGLVEFIPEIRNLISELNDLLAHTSDFGIIKDLVSQLSWVNARLSPASQGVFQSLPAGIQAQLLADRDPHGNVQVSRIETEKLLMETVGKRMAAMKAAGQYKGEFSALGHFFGYEGRCAAPTNFDADYCYALGVNAACLSASGLTGYLSSVRHLCKPASQWQAGGVPLTMMMNMEKRHGSAKPVIKKALVELNGGPFNEFKANREAWALQDAYLHPGPIQYWGPTEVTDAVSETLKLEHAE